MGRRRRTGRFAREPIPRLTDAVDPFLAQPDLADSSRRSYEDRAEALDLLDINQ
jgi:hypothetical protein